jgi:hypothetical protein
LIFDACQQYFIMLVTAVDPHPISVGRGLAGGNRMHWKWGAVAIVILWLMIIMMLLLVVIVACTGHPQ